MQRDDSIKWENLKASLEFCNLVKHAETADQTTLNQRVHGSSPCAPTNNFKGLAGNG